jgi:hypothetical protein
MVVVGPGGEQMRHAIPVLVAVCAIAAEAGEQPRCSALPTAAERIACYDQQFPPDHPSGFPPAHARDSVDASSADAPPTVAEQQTPTPQTPPQPPDTHAAPADQESSFSRLFDRAEPVALTSTIKSLERRDGRNTNFVLANDQVWQQDSTRALSFRVGDAVTIKNGTFGGYFLSNDAGTSTRVRRIK